MAHVQFMDELIREYLLFRGFTQSLKAFDSEVKVDKDRGFRIDKIIDHVLQLVNSYDLNGLRELMAHFNQRMFSKLNQEFTPVMKKLESSLLKFYVINAVSNNKQDKVIEFFSKMVNELHGQSDWKEWYALPYIRNPEENQSFSMYFTKQWQDTFLLSFYNFLSIIYQLMPQPTISNYEKEIEKIRRLEDENEILKQKLAVFEGSDPPNQSRNSCTEDMFQDLPDIIDDFFDIAVEIPLSNNSENTVKSLKKIIRTIGIPTSPLLGRKSMVSNVADNRSVVPENLSRRRQTKARLSSSPGVNSVLTASAEETSLGIQKRSISLDRESAKTITSNRESSLDNAGKYSRPKTVNKVPPFLLLSQDSFDGHRAKITQCLFNSSGSTVASSDTEGVIKIWSPAPSPVLRGTSSFKSTIRCLDWVSKNERFLVFGSEEGVITLYDTKDYKSVWDTGSENNSPLRDSMVYCVSASPTDTSFVCSAVSKKNEHKLLLYDIKAKKLERTLSLDCDPLVFVTCCIHNYNGQLLIAGCSDGVIRTYDLRHSECVDQWHAHKENVLGIKLSTDHTTCYSLGADDKLCRRSLSSPNQCLTWDATLSPDNLSKHPGHKFTLDQSCKYVLLCYGQSSGGSIFKITNMGLTSVLPLKGHNTPTTACDWATANQCCTCVTASVDGKICVSTLLMP